MLSKPILLTQQSILFGDIKSPTQLQSYRPSNGMPSCYFWHQLKVSFQLDVLTCTIMFMHQVWTHGPEHSETNEC